MREIFFLIGCLSSNQLRLLKFWYELNSRENSQKIKLLNIITENNKLNENEISNLIYGDVSSNKFNQLKYRVRLDIISLIAAFSMGKNYTSQFFRKRAEVRREIVLSDVGLGAGKTSFGFRMLKKTLKKAESYELLTESLIVLDTMQRHFGQTRGFDEYLKYNKIISKTLNRLQATNNAHYLYYEAVLPKLLVNRRKYEAVDIDKTLSKLESLYHKSRVSDVYALYLRLAVYYYYNLRLYEKAYEYADNFKKFVKSNHVVYSKSNEAGASMQIAILCIHTDRIEIGCENALHAVSLFDNIASNSLRALNVLAVLYTRSENIEGLGLVLTQAESKMQNTNDDYHNSVFLLRKASLHFYQKDFHLALELINKHIGNVRDKRGWQVGYKLLEIMCIIELGYLDWYEYRLLSFYRLIKTHRIENHGRIQFIYNILNKHKVSFFDGNMKKVKSSSLIKELSSNSQLSYDPLSFEVVQFDKWILSK